MHSHVVDLLLFIRIVNVSISRMVTVMSWYLMSEVLFSSLQFKFAQCHTWVMKKKNAKHKQKIARYFVHGIQSRHIIKNCIDYLLCSLKKITLN